MSNTRLKRICNPFYVVKYARSRLMVVLLFVICLVSFMLLYQGTLLFKSYTGKIRSPTSVLSKERVRDVACRLPVLDPFHSSVVQFTEDLGKLRCEGTSYSSFENNVLRVEGEGIVSAWYSKIERTSGNDFDVELSDPVKIQHMSSGKNGELFLQHFYAYAYCEIFRTKKRCINKLLIVKYLPITFTQKQEFWPSLLPR